MKKGLIAIPVIILATGCGEPAYRLVYSSGFTFSRYDLIIMSRSDSEKTSTSLYGLDIELANMLTRYNMKIIGDKEYQVLPQEQKQKTLLARMSMIASSAKMNLISISFDDAISGKTVASVTAKAKGNMFDVADRTKAMESVSDALLQALQRDKGLLITDSKTNLQ